MKIHVARNGTTLGAFDIETLKIKAAAGSIRRTDHVYTDKAIGWKLLSDLPDLEAQLFPEHEIPPPPPIQELTEQPAQVAAQPISGFEQPRSQAQPSLTFSEHVSKFMSHYDIRYRSSRKEYWLLGALVGFVLKVVIGFLAYEIASWFLCFYATNIQGAAMICSDKDWPDTYGIAAGQIIGAIFAMRFTIPIAIRRAHDLNKTGNFLWLICIPFYGIWPAIQLGFFKGVTHANAYGADPVVVSVKTQG